MLRKTYLLGFFHVAFITGFFCASCTTTGPQRVEFETLVIGIGGQNSFENVPPEGVDPWTITLDEAWVALGPVYLFEGEPLMAKLFHKLILPRAHAHPGHYQEGEAMGEALDQVVVDLLSPEPTSLGLMNAVTGDCHSARIGLGTAESGLSHSDRLRGHSLYLSGEATQGSETVSFEAWLDRDLYIEGITFEQEIDENAGVLLVEVDLTRWLRRVDFSTARSGETSSERLFFEEQTQAHNALVRGVDNTLAYEFVWEEI